MGPVVSSAGANLRETITEMVADDATLMTAELQAYGRLAKGRRGKHFTVNHSKGEYARGDAPCNSAESFFALHKRGIHGSFHHVDRQHLHRYCDEFSFRCRIFQVGAHA